MGIIFNNSHQIFFLYNKYINMTEILCKLNDFFNKKSDKGSCELKDNSAAFISIWNNRNENFSYKIKSFFDCFERNKMKKPDDMTTDNTLWIEILKNGGQKGFGKKFLDIFKMKALENKYKYVFLYPSKEFGGRSDQEGLIKYYESVGFKRLNSCDYYGMNEQTFETEKMGTINKSDGNAQYHLLFTEIANLNTRIEHLDEVPIDYQQKYLKYKNKYLELRKKTNTL